MRKSGIIIIILLLLVQSLSAQTYLNRIGFDFFSPYMVKTPKYDLPGNKYIPELQESTSRSFGFFYERAFNNKPFRLMTGAYLNTQFGSLVSAYVPVEFDGDVFGNSRKTTLFAGYTVGLNLNFIISFSGITVLADNVISMNYLIKKQFYAAPYAGINAGINMEHFSILFHGLFNFFVPEFVSYQVVYKNEQGKEITENNTNKNWGMSFRLGVGYRF